MSRGVQIPSNTASKARAISGATSIDDGLSPEQSRQINHLLTGRRFGEGQVFERWVASGVAAADLLLVDLRASWN